MGMEIRSLTALFQSTRADRAARLKWERCGVGEPVWSMLNVVTLRETCMAEIGGRSVLDLVHHNPASIAAHFLDRRVIRVPRCRRVLLGEAPPAQIVVGNIPGQGQRSSASVALICKMYKLSSE